jgi:hypothetical protein
MTREREIGEPRRKTTKLATPLPRSKFQFFPALPHDRREALRTSIIEHGVERATVWDEEGNLLDGWERENLSQEEGTNCPREVRHFGTDQEKFQFVLAVNAHRRPSLNREQKRAVIEAYLRGDPKRLAQVQEVGRIGLRTNQGESGVDVKSRPARAPGGGRTAGPPDARGRTVMGMRPGCRRTPQSPGDAGSSHYELRVLKTTWTPGA